jgi:hypothetical protein
MNMNKNFFKYIFSLLIIVLTTVSIAYSGEPVLSKTDKVESKTSFTVGYLSEFWNRGSFQAASVAYANVAYTSGPIYLSAGLYDLRDRKGSATYNEGEAFVSLYGSYNFKLMSVPTYVGLAAYRYTDGIDQHYNEVSVGADFDVFSVDAVIIGDWDTSPSSDYWHWQISVPLGAIDYTYGTYSGAWQYVFQEVSYGTSVGEIDLGLKLGRNNDNAAGTAANSNQNTTYAVVSVSYSF